MEREAMVQNPSSHCRNLTGRKVHTDEIMYNPVHISPFLESSCCLGIPIGTSAIGRTASSQRRMEGFQMMGMHIPTVCLSHDTANIVSYQ